MNHYDVSQRHVFSKIANCGNKYLLMEKFQ